MVDILQWDMSSKLRSKAISPYTLEKPMSRSSSHTLAQHIRLYATDPRRILIKGLDVSNLEIIPV